MSDLPKVTKDADDLVAPGKTNGWRKVLSSTLAAIAASVAVGTAPAHTATSTAVLPTSQERGSLTSASKLVFQPSTVVLQTAQHQSHFSHSSHVSHASHQSHYSSSY